MAQWDDDRKALAIKLYLEKEPTPENSMECVKEVADEMDESPNGVRMILSKAEVYVKKEAAKSSKSSETKSSTGGTRVSKEASQKALTEAIAAVGRPVDDEIISKLTGKAAVYFTTVLQGLVENDE